MQLTAKKETQSNIEGSTEFKISNDAHKLFAMLGQALYSNKEGAVCYELSTNAVDEHNDCGKGHVPFEITFPTNLDSNIRFRDFGRGLSEDNVYRFLCTYGESNKTASSLLVGGFGIGFKAIAAVSETWTIRSHYQGMLTDYFVFINDHGNPAIKKLREEETTETGLEIIIPVHQSRFNNWAAVLRGTFHHFEVAPVIHNLHVTNPDYDWGGKDWRWHNKQVFVSSFREYPANKDKLMAEMPQHLRCMVSLNFMTRFSVDALPKSLSREEIQYTKKCVAIISDRYQEVFNELKASYEAAVAAAVDGLDYRSKLSQWAEKTFPNCHDYYNSTAYGGVINKIIAGNAHGVNDFFRDITAFNTDMTSAVAAATRLRVYSTTRNRVRFVTNGFDCWKTRMVRFGQDRLTVTIRDLPKISVVRADCRDAVARVRQAHLNSHASFKGIDYVIMSDDVLPCKELAVMEILASSLPVPVKASRTVTVRDKVDSEVFVRPIGFTRFNRKTMADINATPITKQIWVVIENASTGAFDGDDLTNGKIIGILTTRCGYVLCGAKSEKSFPAGAMSIQTAASTYIASFESLGLPEAYSAQTAFNYKNAALKEIPFRSQSPSKFNDILNKLEKIGKMALQDNLGYDYRSYELLTNLVTGKHPVIKDLSVDVRQSVTELFLHYPMLKYVNDIGETSSKQDILAYVAAVGV